MSAAPPPISATSVAERLFAGAQGRFRAAVEATESGMVAGMHLLDPAAAQAPCGQWRLLVDEGAQVAAGTPLVEVVGSATEIGIAEDYVLGGLGFASGVATRARALRLAAPPGLSIACGGWKKLPVALKPLLRAGLAVAGILPRLIEGDFVYIGKNGVTMLGDVAAALAAGRAANHGPVAIQVKSVAEAQFAAGHGAGIIMVDTGVLQDLADVHAMLKAQGWRDKITLAFGGGVRGEDLAAAHAMGADAVDIGRAILDAPLLDLRLTVTDALG